MRAIVFSIFLTSLATASVGQSLDRGQSGARDLQFNRGAFQGSGQDQGPVSGPLGPRPLGPTYGLYGTPGLIEMPTAQAAPDAELAVSFSYAGPTLRNSLTFQVGERLSGTFRYSRIEDFSGPGLELFDRSFDLRYQVVREGTFRPAVAVGLQDFIGTGSLRGEYVVASKTLGSVTATAGLGWGRFGSYRPLGTLGTRPAPNFGQGGQIEYEEWFRGDYAAFGGLSWAVGDKLTLKAEYSSDANSAEVSKGSITRDSPINLGADYRIRPGVQLSAYGLYGSEIGVMASFTLNPKFRPGGQSREAAPEAVLRRAPGAATNAAWAQSQRLPFEEATVATLGQLMTNDGFVLDGVVLEARQVTIRYRNTRHLSQAQAAGRVARMATRVLPPSVERFILVPMVRGLPGAQIVISRSALERFEYAPDGAAQILGASQVVDAAAIPRSLGTAPAADAPAGTPKLTWNIAPYGRLLLFDPANPLRLDAGVDLSAEWNPVRGLYFSGTVRQRLLGNADESTRFSDSTLPHVRSDGNFYDREGSTLLEHLTVAYHFRPATNLYGRVTAGYLERMYGGVSGEVLWKPVASRLALGAELNWVKQRSFDGGFGFSPLTVVGNPGTNGATGTVGGPREYDVVTGHVSAYYALNNGYHAQLDVGRYLAGDYGATITVDREFDNGWRVGAYATLTDVSAAEFGEGSFDKGIRVSIPIGWSTGTATRRVNRLVLQPLSRDGGARVFVRDRLYPLVRDTHRPELEASWGRFWR